jgi:hypothetical protein
MSPLRRRMIEDMQIRNLTPNTQRVYVAQVVHFASHFRKSPDLLGPAEIRSYLLHLTRERRLAASSIIVTVSALRFFYTVTLKRPWVIKDDIPAGHQAKKLPVQRVPDLAKQPLYRRADGLRGARGRVLVLQARYFRTVGTSIQGHDVSETAWQTVNRAIESITTMMPVRQCGHSRNDRPVSASKLHRIYPPGGTHTMTARSAAPNAATSIGLPGTMNT